VAAVGTKEQLMRSLLVADGYSQLVQGTANYIGEMKIAMTFDGIYMNTPSIYPFV
jgi:hypothetical protein